LKIRAEGPRSVQAKPLDCVIPAWSAGIQADTDVSGRIPANLDAGHPCRHDEDLHFSCSVGVRKIMNHFVVNRKTVVEHHDGGCAADQRYDNLQ
jgi:hypothetical protein